MKMKSVEYDGSAKSVNEIIDLVKFTKGILNCFGDLKQLLFCNEFFNIGTIFYENMIVSTKGNYIIQNKKIKKIVSAA